MSVVSLRFFSFSPTYIVIDCIILSEQLGLAMAGITVGLLLGAPVGGALYGTLGYRAPFIFGIIFTVLDRLLIIERKNVLKYGWDPREEILGKEEKKEELELQRKEEKEREQVGSVKGETTDTHIRGVDEKGQQKELVSPLNSEVAISASGPSHRLHALARGDDDDAEATSAILSTLPAATVSNITLEQAAAKQTINSDELRPARPSRPPSSHSTMTDQRPRASMLGAIVTLGKSSRAMTAFMNAMFIGYVHLYYFPVFLLFSFRSHLLT
jgi:hypothetical protein